MSVFAIVTKYVGPTDHKGSRIKVTQHKDSGRGTGFKVYNQALDGYENHVAAAQWFKDGNAIPGTLSAGHILPDGSYVFTVGA